MKIIPTVKRMKVYINYPTKICVNNNKANSHLFKRKAKNSTNNENKNLID